MFTTGFGGKKIATFSSKLKILNCLTFLICLKRSQLFCHQNRSWKKIFNLQNSIYISIHKHLYLGSLFFLSSCTNVSISVAVMCCSSSFLLLCTSAVIVSSASMSCPICCCIRPNCFAMYSCWNSIKLKMSYILTSTDNCFLCAPEIAWLWSYCTLVKSGRKP